MATNEWNSDREYHESLVSDSPHSADRRFGVRQEEIRTTPLFSADVLAQANGAHPKLTLSPDVLPSYSFLGKVLDTFGVHEKQDTDDVQTSGSSRSGVAISSND